jgi:hypothetical protein
MTSTPRSARTITVALVLAMALSLSLGLAGAGAATKRATSQIPDVTVLFSRALAWVRGADKPSFRRAIVYEADGATRRGRLTKSASGIVSWRFVFDNYGSKSRSLSATVSYGPAPKRFGRVAGSTQPFLEDVNINRAPRMTLAKAVTRLQKTGHRQGFYGVVLRDPLGPTSSNPLYIFTFAHSYIAVDTVTGKVTTLTT